MDNSTEQLRELHQKSVSRRNFLAGAGAVGAATALAGCGSTALPTVTPPVTTPTAPTTAPTYVDADYLNFALNLEYLEASFYLFAATGAGLPAASMGSGAGTVSGGAAVTGLTTAQQQIINEIAYNELSHVNFLRAALSTSAVAMPNLNIGTAFNTLASAAGLGSTFNPYASFSNFLLGAFIFEDVGVTAYSGAAPLLTSAANLNYAAGIQAVEAYHAAYIRTTLTALAQAANSPVLLQTANAIAGVRASLGGGMETNLTQLPQTIPPSGFYTASSIVSATTANAIAFARTTDQVLHIVYGTGGGAGVSSGVFFPNGLNGNIKTTYS